MVTKWDGDLEWDKDSLSKAQEKEFKLEEGDEDLDLTKPELKWNPL